MAVDMEWFEEQVAAFEQIRPRYVVFARVLRDVLEDATDRVAPLSIVQARAKSVPSFAEKILRKREKYRDPVHQLTDLCGARVITHTKAEIHRICSFIRGHFEIDEANSLDAMERLRATEFGYRSVHYVVEFKRGVFDGVPEEMYGLKAEIQVRTIVQHAWADIGHDRLYKTTLKIPDRYLRESARAAAMLENADEAFARLVAEVDTYRTCYDAYMDTNRMREELAILEAVFHKDQENPDLARRIARLAICLEDWDRAIGFVEDFEGPKSAALLICLGRACCQKHRGDRSSAGYQQGRNHLEEVVRTEPENLEALTLLGDTWIGIDDKQALFRYSQAFQTDPGSPAAVAGYLALRIAEAGDGTLAAMFAPNLKDAITRCREQIEIGVNLPAAWYHMGQFLALLRKPYESLAAYCRAISLTSGQFMLDDGLRPIEKMAGAAQTPVELAWIVRLLRLAKAAKFAKAGPKEELADLLSTPAYEISPPVVIVVGGCDASVEVQMQAYRDLLVAAFEESHGTILSGGTTAGISGLVGELTEVYPNRLRTIGYLPKFTPAHVVADQRYSELRVTDGTDFSALEPIQNWIDLVASGVEASAVKVLGINGGTIAAFEYRLALAMGAQVGVLEDSGREAGKLIGESRWETIEGLARLFPDPKVLNTFIRYGGPCSLTPEQIETVAEEIHERFRAQRRTRLLHDEPALAGWKALAENLKESNRQQAGHIDQKLEAVGKKAVPVSDREIELAEFSDDEVEFLAEMEHARWTVERLLDGWTLGPRNHANKTSPYLVSWEKLDEETKQWDRDAVRAIPGLLKKIGFEIQPR